MTQKSRYSCYIATLRLYLCYRDAYQIVSFIFSCVLDREEGEEKKEEALPKVLIAVEEKKHHGGQDAENLREEAKY